MSPKTRAVYKDFSHKLRSKDTQSKGMRHAQELAQRCMAELPECVHWRVDLEMADLCKREKRFREARVLYSRATERMPNAPQTWLEYAKMEEERGHFRRCQHILTAGLQHCPLHEALRRTHGSGAPLVVPLYNSLSEAIFAISVQARADLPVISRDPERGHLHSLRPEAISPRSSAISRDHP